MNLLGIKKDSLRPILSQLEKKEIVVPVTTDSKTKYRAFEFLINRLKPSNSPGTQELVSRNIETPKLDTKNVHGHKGFHLAERFNYAAHPKTDDLHVFAYSNVLAALLGIEGSIELDIVDFLNEDPSKPEKSIEKVSKIQVNGSWYKVSYGSISSSPVATIEDLPFLCVLFSLSIMYHLKNVNEYKKSGKSTLIDVATRVYTESFLVWLGMHENQTC